MKKKIVLLVLLVIILIIGFVVYKFVMLQKYKTDNTIDTKVIFNETINISYNQSDDNVVFEEMSYYNHFSDYVNKENSSFKVKYDNNNEIVSFYNITKERQYINMLNTNSFELFSDNKENDISYETEKNMKEFLDKNNIKDDVDLLNYIKKNYYFKNNIFTCTKTMRNNYIFNSLILVAFPEFKNITLVNGSIRGYIINTASSQNIKEIHLLYNNSQYIITLFGEDITNDDFVKELITSISFS